MISEIKSEEQLKNTINGIINKNQNNNSINNNLILLHFDRSNTKIINFIIPFIKKILVKIIINIFLLFILKGILVLQKMKNFQLFQMFILMLIKYLLTI